MGKRMIQKHLQLKVADPESPIFGPCLQLFKNQNCQSPTVNNPMLNSIVKFFDVAILQTSTEVDWHGLTKSIENSTTVQENFPW